eukprot:3639387-Pleurochrysis_carterae.AAC.1
MDALPVVACTCSATYASVASCPRLTRVTTAPLSVRSDRSTSQRYLGRVVPLAVTMSVLFACTLPATAMRTSVIQCIPAPVSPNHFDLALIGAAPAGNDCIAVE